MARELAGLVLLAVCVVAVGVNWIWASRVVAGKRLQLHAVAASSIPCNSEIAAGDVAARFGWIAMALEESPPLQGDADAAAGKYAARPIAAGEILRASMLSAAQASECRIIAVTKRRPGEYGE